MKEGNGRLTSREVNADMQEQSVAIIDYRSTYSLRAK
jgi:hypothetical protein